MAENVVKRLSRNKNDRFPRVGQTNDFQPFEIMEPGDSAERAQARNEASYRIILLILFFIFLLAVAAFFSPIGSLLFLGGLPGAGDGGGSGGGTGSDICEAAGDCDVFVSSNISTDGLTLGEGDPTLPVDIYNENVTFHNGSTVTFEPGSAIVCPDPGFLNDCVDEGAAFSPTCTDDYAGCTSGSPLTVGGVSVTEELAVESGASILFAAGSTVTCPTPGFLNDCVDEASSAPTCDEHALCTNFLVTGMDVVTGVVTLQVGADLLTTDGSTITMVNGSTQTFQSGSTLVFGAGSDVQCPTADFLNDCVNQPASQICATDYNQCNGADPFVVGQLNVNDGIQLTTGGSLEFLAGSTVTCPAPGFLNDCVDEGQVLQCDSFATCGDFEVQGGLVNGGLLALQNGADMNLGNNSTLTMQFGSTLEFAPGSQIVCPSPDFFNDCVDVTGTTLTCDDYATCAGGDPFIVGELNVTETLTVPPGAQVVFDAGSTVTCPTPDFLNACVNETGGGGGSPNCTEHSTCTEFEVTGANVLGGTLDLEAGANLTTTSGSILSIVPGAQILVDGFNARLDLVNSAKMDILDSDVYVDATSTVSLDGTTMTVTGGDINFLSGGQLTMNAGTDIRMNDATFQTFGASTASCASPLFNPSSGCTSSTFARSLNQLAVSTIPDGGISTPIVVGTRDTAASTLSPGPVSGQSLYTIPQGGLYTFTINVQPIGVASDQIFGISMARTYPTFGTPGTGTGAAVGPTRFVLCDSVTDRFSQSSRITCSITDWFDSPGTVSFVFHIEVPQLNPITIGSAGPSVERFQVFRHRL